MPECFVFLSSAFDFASAYFSSLCVRVCVCVCTSGCRHLWGQINPKKCSTRVHDSCVLVALCLHYFVFGQNTGNVEVKQLPFRWGQAKQEKWLKNYLKTKRFGRVSRIHGAKEVEQQMFAPGVSIRRNISWRPPEMKCSPTLFCRLINNKCVHW